MSARPPVAVVGVNVMFPGTPGPRGFWRDIVQRRDAIRTVPPTHWLVEDYYDPDPSARDKTYSNKGAFLDPVSFDPMEFGIPPASLGSIDTAQLLSLIVARNVLSEVDRAAAGPVDRSRVSVILGVASATEMVDLMCGRMQRPAWVAALREAGLPEDRVQHISDRIAARFPEWQENTFPGLLGNIVAGRIANRFNLGGGNFVTDAACASSLASVQAGLDELYLGRSGMVLVGGVDALNDILMYMCFSKTPAFSKTGDIRPLSDKADGTIIGEGIGIFAMKLLADAEHDGDHIYAVLRGMGRSSDGRATSVYAPRPEGQALAIRRAYDEAGYAPGTVELIENHGTGTIAGDAAEIAGLRRVFGETASRAHGAHIAIGSVKSQIGHTKAAAGSAGLFKAVMALHTKILPPTIKVEQPNPALELARSPFYINTAPRPWIRGNAHPRRAAVSSFGFGGSNFHVTVEEYVGPGRRPSGIWADEHLLFLASAATEAGLREDLSALSGALSDIADLPGFAAETVRAFRADAPARAAIVARGVDDLRTKLAAAIAGETMVGVHVGRDAPVQGKIAFLFPGQGSQYIGMGVGLAMAFDEARAVWDKAADMAPFADVPLHELAFPPAAFEPEAKERQRELLTRMENAQPAIAAVSLSMMAVLDRLGLAPQMTAGHSFGEVTALHAAGVFGREDTLTIARRRGLAMAAAARDSEGAMIAVPLSANEAGALLKEWDLPGVTIANDNAPAQTILSGRSADVAVAIHRLKERGVVAAKLPVASAFHSSIVAGAREPFLRELTRADIAPPAITVFANTSARPHALDANAIRRALADQIAAPVRFRETVDALYEVGARLFVEVGPASVLTALVDQCLGKRPHHAIALDRKGETGTQAFLSAVAQFAALGLNLKYDRVLPAVNAEETRKKRPPKHAVSLLGTNYNKPYPPADGAAGRPLPNPAMPTPVPPPLAPEPRQKLMSLPQKTPSLDSHAQAAVESLYHQLAQTHAAFQQSMAESHQAFLNVAAQAIASLSGGAVSAAPAMPSVPPPTRVVPPPPAFVAPPAMTAPVRVQSAQPMTPPPMPVSPAAPVAGNRGDIAAEIIAIVAEKTGYPADMLKLDMDLEAELGIDSIKQVEILSTIRERRPNLPEIDPAQLSQLRTLGLIISAVGAGAPAAHSEPRPVPPAARPAARDPKETLLAIVAEKTGYPKDMLNLDHDLEAELGIDSIKQVEILSALREALPSLPEIDPAQLSQLRSLRAILSVMEPANPNQPTSRETMAQAEWANGADKNGEMHGVARYVIARREARAPGFGAMGMAPGAPMTVISLGEDAAAERLAKTLAAHGIAARRGATEEDLTDRLVLLDVDGPVSLHAAAEKAQRAIALARAFANRRGNSRLFATVQGAGSALGALARTARQEWSDVTVKSIEIESADGIDRIAEELRTGSPDANVILAAENRRFVPAIVSAPLAPSVETVLRDGLVVVASGGARGVTSTVLRALAQRHRIKVVLLGRTPLVEEPLDVRGADDAAALKRALIDAARSRGETPSLAAVGRQADAIMAQREIRATLADLERTGATVRYETVDVADRTAVAGCLTNIRAAWGPITALFHGAGVLRDKAIAGKTDAQVEAVMAAKVGGLDALLDATKDDPLEVMCLFSSVAAVFGNNGQADYALANEILNQAAAVESRRRPGCVVKSIAWGPWDGGMVDASLKAAFAARGVPVIAPAAGADFLMRELNINMPDAVVVAGCPALGAASSASAEFAVSRATHPFLLDHIIDGHPVLPLVAAIEWFHRFARALDPSEPAIELTDVRVLKGVVFEDDLKGDHRFTLRGHRGGLDAKLELADADGVVRYAATARFVTSPASILLVDEAGRRPWPWTLPDVYGAALFHGPAFQSLHEMDFLSVQGAEAVLRPVTSAKWPDAPWRTNPTLSDGGLQIAQLWALQATGALFLPTRVERVEVLAESAPDEEVRCRLRIRANDGAKTVNDLDFMRADGSVLMRLRGVEMYRTRIPLPAGIAVAAQ